MRLDDITPVILTYNEEPNIGRVLARLRWARDVVLVDSLSDDRTREIAGGFANTRILQHPFAQHAEQWSYAVRETGIATEWVLVLDADFVVPETFAAELSTLEPPNSVAGYEAGFRYCVIGHPLRHSIFPPRIVLCRRSRAIFTQDGHTQHLAVSGEVLRLRSEIDHDDRKSLTHWVRSQDRYARLERDKLLTAPRSQLRRADRIRFRRWMAPLAVLGYCLFVKKLIFAGLPGWYYTYQRVMAEVLLSLYLIEDRLARRDPL